ncbi:MAG TPA: NTP transferase domain-containing protein [Mycobacteriales bacterium]|nr:NTP transferase domain-containing protein [Mycobacteriales bacterium]
MTDTYDGIVLAGGRARRMGGVSKGALEVGGRRLFDIAVAALAGARVTIAVGTPLAAEDAASAAGSLRWTREDPPGGGPVAALAAGLALASAARVIVLAGDLPFVTPAVVALLTASDPDAVATIAVDGDGRDQPMLGCYSTAALRGALPIDPAGQSMRSVLRELTTIGPVTRVAILGTPPPTLDCDTEADLRTARSYDRRKEPV